MTMGVHQWMGEKIYSLDLVNVCINVWHRYVRVFHPQMLRVSDSSVFKPVWYGDVDCSNTESETLHMCDTNFPIGYGSCSRSTLRRAEVVCG